QDGPGNLTVNSLDMSGGGILQIDSNAQGDVSRVDAVAGNAVLRNVNLVVTRNPGWQPTAPNEFSFLTMTAPVNGQFNPPPTIANNQWNAGGVNNLSFGIGTSNNG